MRIFCRSGEQLYGRIAYAPPSTLRINTFHPLLLTPYLFATDTISVGPTSTDEPKNKGEKRLTRDKEPETRDKKPFSADVISLAVRLEVLTISAFCTQVFRVRRAHFDTAQ